MKNEMLTAYNTNNGANAYILGFAHKGQVYMTAILPHCSADYITLEPASKGQGWGLRLRLRKAHKADLLHTATCLGSADLLTDTVGHINRKGVRKFWNKGEMFEKAVTEFFGQVWEKDTLAFTKGGDLCVNGLQIQIKFDGATFTNTKTLAHQVA